MSYLEGRRKASSRDNIFIGIREERLSKSSAHQILQLHYHIHCTFQLENPLSSPSSTPPNCAPLILFSIFIIISGKPHAVLADISLLILANKGAISVFSSSSSSAPLFPFHPTFSVFLLLSLSLRSPLLSNPLLHNAGY